MTRIDQKTQEKIPVSSHLQEDGVLIFYSEHNDFKVELEKVKVQKLLPKDLQPFLVLELGYIFLINTLQREKIH